MVAMNETMVTMFIMKATNCDEPLGGVDPATRDYILDTILSNFGKDSSVLISTHLIADIERILDEVIFIENGKIVLTSDTDTLVIELIEELDRFFDFHRLI